MKITTTLLTAICASGLLLSAAAQPASGPAADNTTATTPDQSMPAPAATDTTDTNAPDQGANPDQGAANPDQGAAAQAAPAEAAPAEGAPAESQPVQSAVILPRGNAPATMSSAYAPPAGAANGGANDLTLNFNSAPLDMVLNYLSDAAGFIIVRTTTLSGTVSINGKHLTQDEAVDLLNTELNRNGYAAVRSGRTLTVMSKSDAKTRNIPVLTGNNPNQIPDNDEIATWIIPIRFVDAQQLMSDLSSFVSPQATVVANQAGNSILITDTQSNIRHLSEIIKSVDDSAQTETQIRVFRLKYANPNDVATELGNIFPSSSGGAAPVRFGGGGGGPGGGGGGPGRFMRMMAAAGNPQNQRVQKATQVTAVPDARIQAVIVSAPDDLMTQISSMMTDLDVPSERDQNVSVVAVQNADPQQVAQVLQSMFGNGSTSSSGRGSSANSALQQRQVNGVTTMGNTTASSSTGGGGYGGGGGRGGGGGAIP